ncbi:MAG: calcium/sodium antiporter [Candidatus Krumholzibacteria bacterium]|jgi:cation:H+ antiporter|nr:calcium/sodium antiporter [Candidatus Krumholzibacteria bacterium]
MVLAVASLALGLFLLAGGAEALVRGGAALARRLGLTPLVIGLTVVAFGTSAPELIVSVSSACRGYGDLAVGNVVGSNIFNIAVILGLAAVLVPLQIQRAVIRREAPLMLGVMVLAAGLLWSGVVTRLAGIALLALLAAYTWGGIVLARREAAGPAIAGADADDSKESVPTRSLAVDLGLIAGGLGLLAIGSRFFVDGALTIARSLGVSEAVLGLTIVAAGTSLPELATSVVAARRREADIAVGNILGSNVFNVLGVLGLTAVVRPVRAAGITSLDLAVMVGLAALLLPLLVTGRRLERWEGALLLAGFGVYLWLRWPAGG